jgi:hypothetical protein
MKLINILEIKSVFGYRQFKLVKGDISKMAIPVDLLCVSAFAKGYFPVPGTLLGALKDNRDIDLVDLAVTPELDLRNSLNTFFTKEIKDNYIKRLLCIEMVGTGKNLPDVIDALSLSLFAAELKGYKFKTIMMPLLGTGNQGINPSEILGLILKRVEHLLNTSSNIEEIFLVAFEDEQSHQLNESMNLILKRNVSVFQKSQIIATVVNSLKDTINSSPNNFGAICYRDLLELLQENEILAFELAIVGRKICEHVLHKTFPESASMDLFKKIQMLKTLSVPPWMINYFHMLRIFGNSYAHENLRTESNNQMNEQDIVIALFGLERIIDFCISISSGRDYD